MWAPTHTPVFHFSLSPRPPTITHNNKTMRTLAVALTTLCLVAGVVHVLRPSAPAPPSHTLVAPRRAVPTSDAPSHDLVSTLKSLCPRVALPGRRVVVNRTSRSPSTRRASKSATRWPLAASGTAGGAAT